MNWILFLVAVQYFLGRPVCPACGGFYIVKNGLTRHGAMVIAWSTPTKPVGRIRNFLNLPRPMCIQMTGIVCPVDETVIKADETMIKALKWIYCPPISNDQGPQMDILSPDLTPI
ncbi:MAG: hypothetical protein HQL80_02090 [Magnetococcales bacterium]|nr:hypothetical protein [Magnetococcales bacterium]